MIFVGCDVFSSSEEPDLKPFEAPSITFPVDIEYRVYGTFDDRYNPISFIDSTGSPETIGDSLPWSYSFSLDAMQPIYVNTAGIEGHQINSEIWINGELYSSLENTGSGEIRSNLIWVRGDNAKVRYDVSESIQGSLDSGTASVNTGEDFESFNLLNYVENGHVFFAERYNTEPGFTATINTSASYSSEGCYLAGIFLEVNNLSYPLVTKNVCQPGRNTLSVTMPTK